MKIPSMIAMVDHLLGHSTIDTDILTCDEASLVGTEELHHVGDIRGMSHTSCGVLRSIGTFI